MRVKTQNIFINNFNIVDDRHFSHNFVSCLSCLCSCVDPALKSQEPGHPLEHCHNSSFAVFMLGGFIVKNKSWRKDFGKRWCKSVAMMGKMRRRRQDGRWQAGFLPLSAEPNNHLVLAQFQLQSPRRILESSYQVWPACLPPPAAWRRQVRGHQCLLAWRRCGRRTRWGRKRWRSSTLRRSRKKNGPTSQETTMTKIVFQFRNHN